MENTDHKIFDETENEKQVIVGPLGLESLASLKPLTSLEFEG